MNIDCIIIEDEPLAQNLLHDYIEKVDFITLQGTFNNPLEALPFLKNNSTDLVFLDIEMPKLNGMDFLEVLDEKPEIIFTTAYSSHAVKSYEKNALDYLLKPISFDRFVAAVNKFPSVKEVSDKLETNETEESIFIKSDKNLIRLQYKNILYISGLKDYVEFHTEEEKYIVYHTLKELQAKLPDMFSRVHNSYIVNLGKIKNIKDNHVFIADEQIPISGKYRAEIFDKIDKQTL